MHIVPENIFISLAVLAVSFFALTKSADFLVDGAVAIAEKLRVPKIIIGIVLVGLGTTAPEFAVSMISAVRGIPDIAFGNAVGSVIADDGLALALGIIVAPKALSVNSRVLKSAGIFLIAVDVLTFILALNGVFSHLEGLALIAVLIAYFTFVIITEKKNRNAGKDEELEKELQEHNKKGKLSSQLIRFAIGVAGIIVASELLVESAVNIARIIKISEVIIGLSMVAIGTSLPEIATCIVAARKGHGDLAFGDIIGADILNMLWIIGGASAVSSIRVEKSVIFFAFPAMIIVVLTMLLFARMGYKLQRWKGIILLSEYAVYLTLTFILFGA